MPARLRKRGSRVDDDASSKVSTKDDDSSSVASSHVSRPVSQPEEVLPSTTAGSVPQTTNTPYTLNLFEARPSFFDAQGDSALQRSEFYGFYNLLLLVGGMFLLGAGVRNWVNTGVPMDMDLLHQLLSRADLGLLYGCLWVYSAVAWLIQVAAHTWSLPDSLVAVLQHVSQLIMFVLGLSYTYFTEMPFVQSGFFVLNVMVVFMKMHSYADRNRDLRKEYLLAQETGATMVSTATRFQYENTQGINYPDNLTLGNYAYFLLVPSFVYEIEYPRTTRVRPTYLLEKALSALGTFTVIYFVGSQFLRPEIDRIPLRAPLESIAVLLLPFCIFYFLVFFLVFECVANFFAELTRFADRRFYGPWWNCTSFDEFAKEWNKPVHEFLLRHVYLETRYKLQASKGQAVFVTFFFSSLLHELVMAVCFRMVRPYLFALQMFQLPLYVLSGKLRGTRQGNFFFWTSLMLGFPLLATLYTMDWKGVPIWRTWGW